MRNRRLDKIEQKLDMGKPRVCYTFRAKGNDGKITEHSQTIKGYKGTSQVIECDQDDMDL